MAKLLKAVAEREQPRLILLGKQAIDDDNNQTGQMLAALLGWPQGTFASRLNLGAEQVEVTAVEGVPPTIAIMLAGRSDVVLVRDDVQKLPQELAPR